MMIKCISTSLFWSCDPFSTNHIKYCNHIWNGLQSIWCIGWWNHSIFLIIGLSVHLCAWLGLSALPWHHNERDGFSNRQRLDCLLNHLFRRRSKKTSKLRVTGLCEGNPPVTGGFSSQRASNMKMFPFDDVSMCYLALMGQTDSLRTWWNDLTLYVINFLEGT